MKLRARSANRLARIRLLALDVDGVLTDGRLYFGAHGESLKVFHSRDGHGLRLLMASGVRVALLSGRRSAAVSRRARELGIADVVQACEDKVAALRSIAAKAGVKLEHCACLVDDTVDVPLMSSVGFAAAVNDAHPLVRRAAHWVATTGGGCGAVRELCDAILRARAECE